MGIQHLEDNSEQNNLNAYRDGAWILMLHPQSYRTDCEGKWTFKKILNASVFQDEKVLELLYTTV